MSYAKMIQIDSVIPLTMKKQERIINIIFLFDGMSNMIHFMKPFIPIWSAKMS